jgi:hypothetical protein
MFSLGWKYEADILGRTLDGNCGTQRQQQLDEARPIFGAPEGDIHLWADFKGRFEIRHAAARLDIVAGGGWRQGHTEGQIKLVGIQESWREYRGGQP